MSREIDRSIEVRATPADAFQALTEPEELRAWLLDDAQTDQRAGGRFRWVWSEQLSDVTEGTYVELQPPHRLVTEERPDNAPGPITSIYTFDDVGGGRTRIRLVNSGFGDGPEWDEAFERWRQGVVLFLQALKRRLEDGYDRRQSPGLGVSLGPADDGRRVDQVISGSPAERAGVLAGDVIEALDGEAVADYDAISQALVRRQAGETIERTLSRDGRRMSATLELAPRAAAAR